MSMKKLKIYKLDIVQFNRLVDVNRLAKSDDIAKDFMDNRAKRYYSKSDARIALKKYSKSSFGSWIDIVEAE